MRKHMRILGALALALCLMLLLPAQAAQLTALPKPQALKLPGGLRLSIYQGPGEHYGIADQGRAYASSNGLIEAYGRVEGWLLVRYATTVDHMRYGFIPAQALTGLGQGVDSLPLLKLAGQLAYATRTTPVSDVLWRGKELMPQGRQTQALEPLILMASLDGQWALAQPGSPPDELEYVLLALDAVQPADPRAQLSDKPAYWYGSFAPDYFWQQLDQTGYRQADMEQSFHRWAAAYGGDAAFWPLPQQAIGALMQTEYHDVKEEMPGLPAEGDISQLKALEIATQAVSARYADQLKDPEHKAYEVAYGFQFNRQAPGSRSWSVWFIDPEPHNARGLKFRVDIDAKTGEVVNTEVEEKGNG